MHKFRPAFAILGLVLLIVASLMLVPLAFAVVADTANILGFLYSIAVCIGVGGLTLLLGRNSFDRITPRQMFLVTGVNWLGVSLVSALPFIFGETHMSWVDATFEAISGITTTGSTVMVGIENVSQDILLWRSMTQWIGGLGIIGMAVAIFPYLRVGGMRLFQTESSDWTETSGRARSVAWKIVQTYLVLSVACVLTYRVLGMDWFTAINHAMTTISTGGYSTSDASFGRFSTLPLMWAGIIFMIAGALPFMLYFQSLQARKWLLLRDEQVRGMIVIALFVGLVIVVLRIFTDPSGDIAAMVTHSLFNVVSVMTTTGYASADYALWGGAVITVFFCLTFVGGCSGSTSGGVKIFRFQLMAMLTREHTRKSVHPVAFVKRHYNDRPVSDAILISTFAYLFLVLLCFTFFSIALAATGLDPMTSLTGAATALMNVGPGLGEIIGPAGNFSSLNDVAKILLCVAMLLGRLELVTLLVMLTPTFWKW